MAKDTFFCPKKTLNFRGKIINLSSPLVMGILNITPDSFYEPSRSLKQMDAIRRAEQCLSEGAAVLDIGGASSRPGAGIIATNEEQERLLPALKGIVRTFPEAIISVDTYHASTARAAIEHGAHMINDISAGSIDPSMFKTVAELQVPYVIMHMKGTPANMQENPVYGHLIKDIAGFFAEKIRQLRDAGVHDLIIDPGFGFGKTLEQNYQLLSNLDYFTMFDLPVLVGFSRKSMINKVLACKPEDALHGSTVLNTIALDKGAHILRVHDVKAAVDAVKISQVYQGQK